MFTKRVLSLTVIIQITCWSAIALLLLGGNKQKVQAIPLYQASTPEPFLGPIYYGQEDVWQVFDHEFPLFNGDGEDNKYVVHYDGVKYEPPIPNGYGYDAHIGIDYSLVYEPVLAAASGTVNYAGWANPANHRDSYGLYVKMDHTANSDYRTWYGHFSTLVVETGETITITAPYNDRRRILGISGNTGYVFSSNGPCGSVNTDPLCGAHLHFEVRQIDVNRPVNPYGWVAPASTPDPWADHQSGATSYDLWATRPAVEDYTDQYPGGVPLTAPPVNNFLIEIDDSDPNFFSMVGSCWAYRSDTEGINGGYRKATVELVDVNVPPPPICQAEWTFDPTFTAPAGEYDVYVHVPAFASALHALYTIRHNGKTDEAIVVQAAYPNTVHGSWAYIGRYDFGLNSSPLDSWSRREYIQISNQTISDPASTGAIVLADAVRLHPVTPPPDLEIAISQSSDDAGGPNQYLGGINDCGAESSNWNEIYLGHCKNGSSTVSGFRFQNVIIPDGAVVTAARLEFTVDSTQNNVIDVQFQGELTGNAATFSSSDLPRNRSPLTNAVVSWHIANDGGWLVSEARTSPDLSAVIQEVIDQPGWNSGNAIAIIMQPSSSGTAARRVFGWDRYGGNPLQSAKLQIWYILPPPPPTDLTAIYEDNNILRTTNPQPNRIIIEPDPYVILSWQPNPPPADTTFNVYRSRSYPFPSEFYLLASGVASASYIDYDGQEGDWYRVTAVNANGESAPSNQAQANPPCPEC